MDKFDNITNLKTLPDARNRENLAVWWQEYHYGNPAHERLLWKNIPGGAWDRDVEPGQVRVFDAIWTGNPVPFVVLAEWPKEDTAHPGVKRWVVCAFSSLQRPAITAEVEAAEMPPFSVVATWNSAILRSNQIDSCSEYLFDLEEWIRQYVLEGYKTWALRKEVPEYLYPFVGAPLTRLDDPRHEFLAAEARRVGSVFHS